LPDENVKKSGVRKVPLTEAVLNRKKEPSEKESIFFRGRCFFSLPARRFFGGLEGLAP
jgi:hypothetical protein